MQRAAHEVKFHDGTPILSETVKYYLIEKGFKEEQIECALDTISRYLVKKALRNPNMMKVVFKTETGL